MTEIDLLNQGLGNHFVRLRGDVGRPPDASIIIPVNAKADLETVLMPLADIAAYRGANRVEVILVINNYPEAEPPRKIETFSAAGIRVVAVPSARRPGEVIIMSARALGVESAASDVTIHFDADCRIRNATALLDWYVKAFKSGAGVAYSYVGYYDLRRRPSVYAKIGISHLMRFIKRTCFRIPSTRGSNYAARRSVFLELYNAGKLSVDMQIGAAAKLAGQRLAYTARRSRRVYTSGRRHQGGWSRIYRYFRYRLRVNRNAIPTRSHDVTRTSWDGFDKESARREENVAFKK